MLLIKIAGICFQKIGKDFKLCNMKEGVDLVGIDDEGKIMTKINDWNRKVIEEFHTNGGKVGGPFEGKPLLLLTTTGSKSGQRHTTPLAYLPDGDRQIIFASKAGAPTNPDWYHNLVAHPEVTVEVGNGSKTETFEATATVITGEERDRLYAKQAQVTSAFAEYEAKTSRVIPVIALERHTS